MIRVGFVLGGLGDNWIGGLNYFRTLLTAIDEIENKKLEPVVFVGNKFSVEALSYARGIQIIRSTLLDRHTLGWFGRKAVALVSRKGADPALGVLLRYHNIDVLSHTGPVCGIRTLAWIPDFQHVRMPHFFSPHEVASRSAGINASLQGCDRVLLSSRTALSDLESVAPAAVKKARVLHFVPYMNLPLKFAPLHELEQKYDFRGPFFHLPNQFWVHKNHALVVDALGILARAGMTIQVLATGHKDDPRFPNHYTELMTRVGSQGLSAGFRTLGAIPYNDVLALMQYSAAVINPSLSEGWSSTVEEAKILEKIVLLSDIAVHREQAPLRGVFFNPSDPATLASAMLSVLRRSESQSDGLIQVDRYLARRRAFASAYQDIIVELAET